jgi:hypothetical protein
MPLPSPLKLTFDSSLSSGRHPVCPALTIFNCLATIGELAIATQPEIPKRTATRTLVRHMIVFLESASDYCNAAAILIWDAEIIYFPVFTLIRR